MIGKCSLFQSKREEGQHGPLGNVQKYCCQLTEFNDRVNASKEGAVEPSPSLRYELRHCVRHVSDGLGALHVVQDPGAVR